MIVNSIYKLKEKPYNTIESYGMESIVLYGNKFKVGKGSAFNDRCWFNARFGITIGENTLIGPYVIIQSSNHVIKNIDIEQNASDENSWCKGNRNLRVRGKEIIIGNDAWIGANCMILSGAIIPDKCIIGAGTIITKSNSKLLEIGDIVINDVKLRKIGNRRDYD